MGRSTRVALGAFAFAALACSANTEDLGCVTAAECDLGEVCQAGMCEPPSDPRDGGAPIDSSVPRDAGPIGDPIDGSVPRDASLPRDAGPQPPPVDGGAGQHPFPPDDPVECVPPAPQSCACASGMMGVQQCRSDGTLGACYCSPGDRREDLERVRRGVVGSWVGTRTTVWDGTFTVWMRFEASGRYYAECDGCVTTYWGGDVNSPERVYEIYDTYADGRGEGRITVMFQTPNMQPLARVDVSEDENALSFDLDRPDVAAPVEFELTRVPR